MGLASCNCSATIDASGSQIVTVLGFTFQLNFDLDISICPDCSLDSSFVNACFSAAIPVIGGVSVTFEGTPTELPTCFEEGGNQVLEVEVEGDLTFNGSTVPATFNLTLNSSGQVCIDLPIGPAELPCLELPVVITPCSP
jgi:hypothetical protein